MAGIPSWITRLKSMIARYPTGAKRFGRTFVENAAKFTMAREGYNVGDVVDTLAAGSPQPITEKLRQSVTTANRMISTEPLIMGLSKDQSIPRQLTTSGKLKSAQKYRVWLQADKFNSDMEYLGRNWYSFYTDEMKTLQEHEDYFRKTFQATGTGQNKTDQYAAYYGNITFHHALHQRGAEY